VCEKSAGEKKPTGKNHDLKSEANNAHLRGKDAQKRRGKRENLPLRGRRGRRSIEQGDRLQAVLRHPIEKDRSRKKENVANTILEGEGKP